MKEGKKGNYNIYTDLPINDNKVNCDKCNGELVKLHTTLGKVNIIDKQAYRNMYWVCGCSKCNRYVRVFDHKTKIGDDVVKHNTNKIHKLRER